MLPFRRRRLASIGADRKGGGGVIRGGKGVFLPFLPLLFLCFSVLKPVLSLAAEEEDILFVRFALFWCLPGYGNCLPL